MLQYIPKYVRQESDMEYGDLVTHENYNEKLNLNTTQGDYNTEVLNVLLNGLPDEDTYHIPYIDHILDLHEEEIETIQGTLTDHGEAIEDLEEAQESLENRVDNIVDAEGVVSRARLADAITGGSTAANNTYYGKDDNGVLGFINLPEFLYAVPLDQTTVDVDGVYFIPQANSVTENMLTVDVRDKLNRANITDYDLLDNRPAINSVTLTGNKTLSDLGIQAAGDFVTNTDLTTILLDYYTQTQVDNAINTALTDNATQTWVTNALADYATIAALDATTATATNAARVSIGTWNEVLYGSPKTGDILIDLNA